MSNKLYALVGRNEDDGGRYLSSQRKQMMAAAWRLHLAGSLVQVWLVAGNGDLLKYDSTATRRVTDYIVKARAALAKVQS
jgi:hypothetical protein